MTSTTDILNDTTSVQSRIDTVLGSVDRELDWANDSGWQPGDPLYERRSPFSGGQFVRPLFQLLDPGGEHNSLMVECDCGCDMAVSHEAWSPTCLDCEVSWSGPEPCWSCGAPRPKTVSIDVTAPPYGDRIEAQVRDAVTRALTRTGEQMLERARNRFLDMLDSDRVTVGFDGSRDSDAVVFTASPGAMWILPWVANPAAPTMAELTAVMAVSTGLRLDGYQRAFLDVWFPGPVQQPAQKSRPVPLAIDGHAYRRRTKRRRR